MSKRKNSKLPVKMTNSIKKSADTMIQNGLGDALFGFQTNPMATQLSQIDTILINNRFYLISNMRQYLSQLYVEHALIQTIVGTPVDDGFRGGIEIKTKQLSDEQIEDLHSEMEKEEDLRTAADANKWNRLFGGAGIVIMTDQDPETPLDMDAIGPDSPLEFRDVDMWELFWSKQNTSDYSAVIDGPDLNQVEFYDYYGHQLHKSRVIKLMGIRAPSFVRPRLRGWGVSVVESFVQSLNQYLKAKNLTFEILDEFKIDVYKIKNLSSALLTPNGEANIKKRVQIANQQKNYQNAITMDAEDDYIQKELSFAGISETMEGIRMQIASDMRMPLTKVFGISAAGFSSGEDDIENYNAMIESDVRGKIKSGILEMVKIRCQKLYGYVPDDLRISFKPLRMLSAEQEENVKTQKFARLLQAKQAGEISSLDFKNAINKDNILGIQLDLTVETLEPTPAPGERDVTEPKAPAAPKSTISAPEAPEVKNSLDYEKAAYEAAGGPERIATWKKRLFTNPGKVDESLWKKAKDVSMKEYGELRWQFVVFLYERWGGTFS
jgi:phage-related protein (TIGR01555 family)